MINANSFIADELAVKTKYLHKALDQANDIISILEQENSRLKDILSSLNLIVDEKNINHNTTSKLCIL